MTSMEYSSWNSQDSFDNFAQLKVERSALGAALERATAARRQGQIDELLGLAPQLMSQEDRDELASDLAGLDDETLTFLHDTEVKGRQDA